MIASTDTDKSTSSPKVPDAYEKFRQEVTDRVAAIEERYRTNVAFYQSLHDRITAWEHGNRHEDDAHLETWTDSLDHLAWQRDEAPKHRYAAPPLMAVRWLESYCIRHLDSGPEERVIREVLAGYGLTMTQAGDSAYDTFIHPIGQEAFRTEYGLYDRYDPVIATVVARLRSSDVSE